MKSCYTASFVERRGDGRKGQDSSEAKGIKAFACNKEDRRRGSEPCRGSGDSIAKRATDSADSKAGG